jgi:hypothetical protein
MNKDNLKRTAIDAIPYVAVFGISALAVYGVTKIVKTLQNLDFPLDFNFEHEDIDNIET